MQEEGNLEEAMRKRRRRCVLCQQSQKDLGSSCLNQLVKLMEYNSYGGFLVVVFVGWV